MNTSITLKNLLESGVHFGHKASRWNPHMEKYIYKIHKGIHIIDLPQTLTFLKEATEEVFKVVKGGGRILFVGTKTQAKVLIKEAAQKCGQYFVNHRWLGGTLTNWQTISQSIKRLHDLKEKIESPEFLSYTKKEQLGFRHDQERLELALGGIKDMGGLPDLLFVVDINKEKIAVTEALQLGIPIVAVVDTNTDPRNITYPIPGNDDALKAIELYCHCISQAAIEGLQAEMAESGTDIGESAEGLAEAEQLADILEDEFLTDDAEKTSTSDIKEDTSTQKGTRI